MHHNEIEIFLQGEGIRDIVLVRVERASTVQRIVEAAQAQGLSAANADDILVFLEDAELPLDHTSPLEAAGIGHRSRVQVHRCRRVAVTVNYNGSEEHAFSPAATMARVKQWAVNKFHLSEIDATEHVLQICGTTVRPDEDIHIGTLVEAPQCALCFDLVAKQRVEG